MAHRRRYRMLVRLTDGERDAIRAEAASARLTMSDWVRRVLLNSRFYENGAEAVAQPLDKTAENFNL